MQDNETWTMDTCNLTATEQDITRDGAFAWNVISGSADRNGITTANRGCSINNDDDVWQIAFAPGSHSWLNNNAGVTRKVSAPCFWPFVGEASDGELLEADIMINRGLSQVEQGEISMVAEGASTIVHEFGHAMGMDHANEFSTMFTPQPRFRLGRRSTSGATNASVRSTTISCEDARFAVLRHSASGAGRPDAYVSAFRIDGTSHVLNNNWSAVTHPGWFVNVNMTLGNKGKANLANMNGKIVLIALSWIAEQPHEAATGGSPERDVIASSDARSEAGEQEAPTGAGPELASAPESQAGAGAPDPAQEAPEPNPDPRANGFVVVEGGKILLDGDRPPPGTPNTGPPGTEWKGP